MMAKGKTLESVLVTAAFISERIGSPTVYYNGAPITSAAGYGFDSQPFEDCSCVLNIGTVLGALCTVNNDIYESDTDDPSAATALSGASFTAVNSANDERLAKGNIICRDTKRYLFLRTEVQGNPCTVDFSAVWIGGNPDNQPTQNVLEFDV